MAGYISVGMCQARLQTISFVLYVGLNIDFTQKKCAELWGAVGQHAVLVKQRCTNESNPSEDNAINK